MNDKTLGFLGILYRAHKALIGEEALHSHKGALAYIASDASENSKRLAIKASRGLTTIDIYSKVELGKALGKDEVSLVLVTDKKAAEKLLAERKDI
jgi:ribosomal protein L7Ae-like RNA K-turn-binding protein